MRIVRSKAFDDVTLNALRDLAERSRVTDGHPPFSDDLWDAAVNGQTDLTLALMAGADPSPLLGAAFVGRQGSRRAVELLVDPGHRRRGHGGRLLEQVLDAVDDELWLWSHGDHPAARALAARHGLERARELLQLRRAAVVPVPETAPPPGITVRTFAPGRDEEAWLAVNAAAFAWHPEQGQRTLDDLQAAEAQPWFDPEGFFLAFDTEGELVGFHWTMVHSPDPATPDARPIGEVYVLGVAPSAQGSGVGAHLTAVGLRYLARRPGVDEVMLYVEGDNAAALKVYERIGFRRHSTDVAYRRPS